MPGLARVNLLVGTNSSGKTSMLEALYLLASRGDTETLRTVLSRRGERVIVGDDDRRPRSEWDVSHLFTGHEASVGSTFTISATNQTPEQSVAFSIIELDPSEKGLYLQDEPESLSPRLAFQIKSNPGSSVLVPLSRSGGINFNQFETSSRRLRRGNAEVVPAQFITTDSLESQALVSLWDRVALTPREDLVLGALRFVDPDIERIAAQAGRNPFAASRGGFIVKTRGHDVPIPIGSMGDGIWRMLAMAIAITQCAGGMLLVDEIDTGLHYTVMSDMWKLIFGAARELDVQVFATSHSFDCIQSLAQVCVSETDADNRVTLQRMEPGRAKAIPYSEPEIVQAAERNIEVR